MDELDKMCEEIADNVIKECKDKGILVEYFEKPESRSVLINQIKRELLEQTDR